MPTLNSKTLTARVREADLEIIEGIMKREDITFSEFVHRTADMIRSGKSVKGMTVKKRLVSDDIITEIAEIVKLYGGDPEGFFKDLGDRLVNGEIIVEDGVLSVE